MTNRGLCQEDFLARIEKITQAQPKAVILREKDMKEEEYRQLAKKVLEICKRYDTTCILHSFVNAARELECEAIHLPLPLLRRLTAQERKEFAVLGASCHSVEDAVEAEKLGCSYITAGHIFDTECKRGLPGRGISFLQEVCGSVRIPVYAIGGINARRMPQVRQAGAAGACVMSGAMVCADVGEYLHGFQGETAWSKEKINEI